MKFFLLAAALPLAVAPTPIVPPSMQVLAPLTFGAILAQQNGGRITLTAGGSLLPEGGGALPAAAPAVPTASYARIRLQGPPGGHFRLSLTPAAPTLQGAAGGVLRLAAFLPSRPSMDGRFDSAGAAEVDLGGTLDIPAGAPAGHYASAPVHLQMAVDGIPGFAVQTFSVFCTLRSPLLLTTLAPLDFAGLAPGGSAGVFRLDASGAHRSEAAGGPLLVKGRPRPAVIRLTGPARTGYVIILPAEAFLRGPGGAMRMHDFTCTVPRTGMLPEAGLTFQVGAGLDVAAEQAPGIYQGIFTVTVAYP